ncbi:MAG: glyoxalase family protein, partial [Hyphomicrobiales bacterium]
MNENAATKAFYGSVFGWQFQDWGPDYISFSGAGIDGGFDGTCKPGMAGTGVLVVLFADDLPQM